MRNSCPINTISPYTKFFKTASIHWWLDVFRKSSTISKSDILCQLGSHSYTHCWITFSWLYGSVCVVTINKDKSSPLKVTAIIRKIKKRSIMEWFVSLLKGRKFFKENISCNGKYFLWLCLLFIVCVFLQNLYMLNTLKKTYLKNCPSHEECIWWQNFTSTHKTYFLP